MYSLFLERIGQVFTRSLPADGAGKWLPGNDNETSHLGAAALPDGRARRILGTEIDIGRGKSADKTLNDLLRQLEGRTRELAAMNESLRQQERELAELNASLERLVAERTEELSLANQELERLATTDALTGVNNRRRFDEKLLESFLIHKRKGRRFSLLMIDADHFKSINDTHGHQTGDEVLRQLARVLGEHIRATDFLARFGGEEFAILLPDTESEREGLVVAEKIRSAVAASAFPAVGQVTISLGLSVADAADVAEASIVGRADKALYQAKRQGRNRAVMLLADERKPRKADQSA